MFCCICFLMNNAVKKFTSGAGSWSDSGMFSLFQSEQLFFQWLFTHFFPQNIVFLIKKCFSIETISFLVFFLLLTHKKQVFNVFHYSKRIYNTPKYCKLDVLATSVFSSNCVTVSLQCIFLQHFFFQFFSNVFHVSQQYLLTKKWSLFCYCSLSRIISVIFNAAKRASIS